MSRFSKFVKQLRGEGYSENSARAIAYKEGEKKYGKEGMERLAKEGREKKDRKEKRPRLLV